MKNIQVIDGALNCTYDIFAATDDEFSIIFPSGTDIEFATDFVDRVGKDTAGSVTSSLWKRRLDKKTIDGIHGTLFYQLDHKRKYYPTKKEAEMIVAL